MHFLLFKEPQNGLLEKKLMVQNLNPNNLLIKFNLSINQKNYLIQA